MRSATSLRSSLSKSTTGSAGVRSTGSPNRRMGWTVTRQYSLARWSRLVYGARTRTSPIRGAGRRRRTVHPDRRSGSRRQARVHVRAVVAGRPGRGPGRAPCGRCARRRPRAAPRPARRPGRRGTRTSIALLVPGRPAPGRAPRRRPAARAAASRSATASGGPVRLAIRAAGGKPSSRRSASSRAANQAGSQRSSACTGASAAVGDHHHPAAVRGRPGQRGGGEPAAQRLLAGPQVGPGQQRPRVEQQHRAVAALGHRLGARRGHHQRRLARHRGRAPVAARGAHRHAGEGPAQLLGGTPGADHRRPQPPAAAAPGRRSRRPAGRTSGRPATGARRAQRQRAGAVRAAGRGAALGAGHRRQVPAPRHLHQHRRAGGERVPGGPPGQRWAAGRRRRPGRGPAAGRRRSARRAARAPRTVARSAHDLAAPSRSRPAAAPRRCGRTRRPAPRAPASWARVSSTSRACGYGARGSACRSSPSSQIATRPRSVDRRERGRPGADDHRHLAPAGGQEPPVPLGRPERGARARRAGPGRAPRSARRRAGRGRGRRRTTTTAPRPAAHGGGRGLGEPGRPVLAGQRRPHRPRRPAVGQRPQERRARPGTPPTRPAVPRISAAPPAALRRPDDARAGVRRRPRQRRGAARRQARRVAGGAGRVGRPAASASGPASRRASRRRQRRRGGSAGSRQPVGRIGGSVVASRGAPAHLRLARACRGGTPGAARRRGCRRTGRRPRGPAATSVSTARARRPVQEGQPPVVLGLATRSSRHPSTSWPAKRTRTRAPGCAAASSAAGTR